jgi:hypothetical protein
MMSPTNSLRAAKENSCQWLFVYMTVRINEWVWLAFELCILICVISVIRGEKTGAKSKDE